MYGGESLEIQQRRAARRRCRLVRVSEGGRSREICFGADGAEGSRGTLFVVVELSFTKRPFKRRILILTMTSFIPIRPSILQFYGEKYPF